MNTIVLLIMYILELMKFYVANLLLFEDKQKKKREFLYLLIVSVTMYGISLVIASHMAVYGMGMLGGWFLTVGNRKERVKKYISLIAFITCMDIIPETLLGKAGILANLADILAGIVSLGIFSILLLTKKYIFIKVYKIKNVVQLLLVILCISLGFGVAVIRDWMSYLPDRVGRLNYDLILVFTFVSIILLVFLSIYMERTNHELERSVEREKELRRLQKKNSDLILKKGEETRKYRHDMSHHLSCLYQIAQKEEASETLLYLEKIQHGLLAIQRMNYETGLEVLDILLNVLLSDLSDVEIMVEGKIRGNIVLDEVESCTVFSNLVQNAIDELQRQKEGKKKLQIQVTEGKLYSKIRIANTMFHEKKKDVLTLETEKEDKENHGYGLKNVTTVLEKKDGNLKLEIKEGIFIAEVTIRNR